MTPPPKREPRRQSKADAIARASMAEVPDARSRRVQFVVGKGGVGRSAVAAALALGFAREGKRTLLLEVDGSNTQARLLGRKPARDVPREVEDQLWLCTMTPEGSMREYALMVLRFKTLYQLVFENRLVKYLLRSIPSLGEFTLLGKAWYHTTEKRGDEPLYERIVVDAPATGHAVTFLGLARTVAQVAPPGIMREASEKMAEMVEHPEDTCLHVVTLAEEMPVNEALELVEAAQEKLHAALGLGVVNRVKARCFEDGDLELLDELRALNRPEVEPYVEAADVRLLREQLQGEQIARFSDEAGLSVIELPEFVALSRDELMKLSALLLPAQETT